MSKSFNLLAVCSLMAGIVLSTCQGPTSVVEESPVAPEMLHNAKEESTVLYEETFVNSVTLEFREDADGALSYGIKFNADEMKDVEGLKRSIAGTQGSACGIYQAVKNNAHKDSGSVTIPDEVVAIDSKVQSFSPMVQPYGENFIKGETIAAQATSDKLYKTKVSLGVQEDDNYFLGWFNNSPGSKNTVSMHVYSLVSSVGGYHQYYTVFNSSYQNYKEYKHFTNSGVLLFTEAMQPREVFIHSYLRTLSFVSRRSTFNAAGSPAEPTLYLGTHWDVSPVFNTNDQSFAYTVQNRLAFVDFNANWCSPCVQFAPHFETVAKQIVSYAFVSVNVDKCPQLAANYGITSIPAIFVMKNGSIKEQFTGTRDAATFLTWCTNMTSKYR